MKRYFYEVSLGYVGMNSTGLIETDGSEEEIYEYLREKAIENADSFGFYQDEDYFGDLDQVGRDWDEDEEEYSEEGQLEYWFEEYNPEEHDGRVYEVEFEEL